MHIAVRGETISGKSVAQSLEKRQKQREAHVAAVASRGTRGESEFIKSFDGTGSKRGLRHVASFHPQHSAHLERTYGRDWMSDKRAIAHAAERDPIVARQANMLRYAADAMRDSS